MTIIYKTKTATEDQIFLHLLDADNNFSPPLSKRVGLRDFAHKIHEHAVTFEAWHGDILVGLISAYFNRVPNAYINHVAISYVYKKKGIASKLMERCLAYSKAHLFSRIDLEVSSSNKGGIALYRKFDFKEIQSEKNILTMRREVSVRDYNTEGGDTADHKYAYNFDFDIMHPLMVRSFQPFFVEGQLSSNVLELGSYKGDFTERLTKHFGSITCVEASSEALAIAKNRSSLVGTTFIESTFETVKLPTVYDNVILTHVLEHLDDPVAVLKRINNEWLSAHGRFFVACPNANAASRQIAVNMGLIPNNSAITPAEKDHGHQITYTLDTLERDVRAAGLKVVHRGGIFFKALANFQWDRLLQTDIISKEYMEGCYQLGQKYPDLCSSIFLVCEKGSNE